MSRIIRTEQFERVDLTAESDQTPKPRVIRREIIEARAEAHAIVKEAHRQAHLLDAQARERVAHVAQTAADEMRAREEANGAALVIRLEEERRLLHVQACARGKEFAVLLAERLIGHALMLDPHLIDALATQTLAEARGSANVTLVSHPDDSMALKALLTNYPSVRLDVDASLSRGDLRLVTNLGVIDACIRPQLAQLARALDGDV